MDFSTFSKETLIAVINDLQKEIEKLKYAADVRITKIEENTRHLQKKIIDTKEISTQTENISNDKVKLPYIKLATNNLALVLADPKGARCVYCYGSPIVNKNILTIDESTIICNLCGVDAVIPASKVINEKLIKEWHRLGFGYKMKPFEINDNCNVWYMNGNAEDLKKWDIQVKNNYVCTWSDNGKNDSIQQKIKKNDIIAWYIVTKGYNSILRVLDIPHLITDEELKLTMTNEEVQKKRESMKTHNYSIIFIPVEFLRTTTTNFVKKESIADVYNKEWSGGLRGPHCINPTNSQWKEQVFKMYNYLKKFDNY
jgi:hypothetical protein